jgi:hypothetical protein
MTILRRAALALAFLAAVPAAALDRTAPPMRIGPGSSGPADALTVNGQALSAVIAGKQPFSANLATLAANLKVGTTTLSVCASGCAYTNPQDAWNATRGLLILGAFTSLTIQIADGAYAITAPFYTNDPATAAVRFRGNCTTPANVQLNFTNIAGNNAGGFVADGGGALGTPGSPGVDCLTINGVGARSARSTWADQSYGGGLAAIGAGSRLYAGPKVSVQGFYYGAIADHAGFLRANGATFKNSGDVNVLSRFSATIQCLKCTMQTASHIFTNQFGNSETLGYNAMAEAGASLYVDGSTMSDAQVSCVIAQTSAAAWAHQIQASGCLSSGGRAVQNGFLELNNSRITGSASGAYAGSGGAINADALELDHNQFGGLVLDGGRASGSGLKIHDNGGFAIKITKQGRGEFYNTSATLTNNTSGPVYVEQASGCTSTSAPCAPASSLLLN